MAFRWRALALASAILVWVGPMSFALASSVDFGEHDVRSVFPIEKSQNRNQVHYGVHLSEACVPPRDAPVYVYWRELRKGQNVFLRCSRSSRSPTASTCSTCERASSRQVE
jgi:Domain of unknown function (DUF4833)